jgi:hypothetical protein
MSATVLPFARPGAAPAGYAVAVVAAAAVVRRGLADRAGYATLLEGARAANAGVLPDHMVVQVVDYGVTWGRTADFLYVAIREAASLPSYAEILAEARRADGRFRPDLKDDSTVIKMVDEAITAWAAERRPRRGK